MPLLLHVATHAFAGFGRYVLTDLENQVESGRPDNLGTTVGARLVIGGWL